MKVTGNLKSINELVKEGYEVTVDEDYIYINGKNVCDDMGLRMYDALDNYSLKLEQDGKSWYKLHDDEGSYYNQEIIPAIFLKNIETNTLDEFDIGDYIVELNKDKSITVGCQDIDAKLSLKIAKAIMKVNGYEIAG